MLHHFPVPGSYRRVLFICKRRTTNYGGLTSSGLLNSARMLAKSLAECDVETKVVDVIDGNSIDREVHRWKPTHVVLEAFWCPPYKLAELVRLYPKVRWTVRTHSKTPFIAGEGIAYQWAFEYARILHGLYGNMSANSTEVTDEWTSMGLPTVKLRNVYCLEDVHPPKNHREHGVLDVGCFGALRLLKNQLIQATAAIQYADRHGLMLRFHINVSRVEMEGANPYKNIKALFANRPPHQLVEHGWYDHSKFLQVIRTMDILLQVSYTETFNIVAADAVSQGVPVVGSEDICWLPADRIADPNSAPSIRDRITQQLMRNARDIQTHNLAGLEVWNRTALTDWAAWLS